MVHRVRAMWLWPLVGLLLAEVVCLALGWVRGATWLLAAGGLSMLIFGLGAHLRSPAWIVLGLVTLLLVLAGGVVRLTARYMDAGGRELIARSTYARCGANLLALHRATLAYCDDWDGWLPPAGADCTKLLKPKALLQDPWHCPASEARVGYAMPVRVMGRKLSEIGPADQAVLWHESDGNLSAAYRHSGCCGAVTADGTGTWLHPSDCERQFIAYRQLDDPLRAVWWAVLVEMPDAAEALLAAVPTSELTTRDQHRKVALQTAIDVRRAPTSDTDRISAALIERSAGNVEFLTQVGTELGGTHEEELAEPLLARACELAPTPERWLALARQRAWLGRAADAVSACTAGLHLASGDPDLLRCRAAALLMLDRYDEAAIDLERVVLARRDDLRAWDDLAMAYLWAEEFERADWAAERAFMEGHKPTDFEILRARSAHGLNDRDKLLASLARLESIDPGGYSPCVGRALLAEFDGDREGMMREVRAALDQMTSAGGQASARLIGMVAGFSAPEQRPAVIRGLLGGPRPKLSSPLAEAVTYYAGEQSTAALRYQVRVLLECSVPGFAWDRRLEVLAESDEEATRLATEFAEMFRYAVVDSTVARRRDSPRAARLGVVDLGRPATWVPLPTSPKPEGT